MITRTAHTYSNDVVVESFIPAFCRGIRVWTYSNFASVLFAKKVVLVERDAFSKTASLDSSVPAYLVTKA